MMRVRLQTETLTMVGVCVAVAFVLVPFAALLAASLLPSSFSSAGLSAMWGPWTIKNHGAFLGASYAVFAPHFLNTVLVAALAAAIVAAVSIPFGYACTRHESALLRIAYSIPFLGYLVPPILLAIPYSQLLAAAQLYNSTTGLVLANVAFCLPFGLGLMVKYFAQAPRCLDEAATLDGAIWWQAAIRIVLPQVLPGIVAVAAFAFVLSWNDVALSLILTEGSHRTIAAAFNQDILDTDDMKNYGEYAAASLWGTVPLLVVAGLLMHWLSGPLFDQRRDS